jgi:HK97 gp10 family phage protein
VKIELSGLDQLSTRVQEAITQGLDVAADAIVADAKQRAPVKTGFMRDSKTGFMRDSTVIEDAEDPAKRTLHAQAEYSGFVDMGTAHQHAQPWFTPAVDQGRQTFAEAIARALREALG